MFREEGGMGWQSHTGEGGMERCREMMAIPPLWAERSERGGPLMKRGGKLTEEAT